MRLPMPTAAATLDEVQSAIHRLQHNARPSMVVLMRLGLTPIPTLVQFKLGRGRRRKFQYPVNFRRPGSGSNYAGVFR